MSKWMAPEGATWVCPACGRYGKERDRLGDTACVLHAVLCAESSLVLEDGRVRHAEAITAPEVANENAA